MRPGYSTSTTGRSGRNHLRAGRCLHQRCRLHWWHRQSRPRDDGRTFTKAGSVRFAARGCGDDACEGTPWRTHTPPANPPSGCATCRPFDLISGGLLMLKSASKKSAARNKGFGPSSNHFKSGWWGSRHPRYPPFQRPASIGDPRMWSTSVGTLLKAGNCNPTWDSLSQ